MRVLSTATIFLVAAGFAAPASAQEDGSFTGPRVEAIAGWDNFSAGHGESDSEDDFVFGGAIGYDYQMQNIVVGAELELTGAGTSSTVRSYMTPSDLFRVEADRDIYIGARLGYAFTPQFLGYVKAGYTNLRIESTYIPSVPGRNTIDDAADSDGFRAGPGVPLLARLLWQGRISLFELWGRPGLRPRRRPEPDRRRPRLPLLNGAAEGDRQRHRAVERIPRRRSIGRFLEEAPFL